ncbi:hypothetical protein EON65_23345 [archaeon]|nr:MAG: hypothetical protein EON65_23345 [archaeon]
MSYILRWVLYWKITPKHYVQLGHGVALPGVCLREGGRSVFDNKYLPRYCLGGRRRGRGSVTGIRRIWRWQEAGCEPVCSVAVGGQVPVSLSGAVRPLPSIHFINGV